MSLSEYARQVGKRLSTTQRNAHGCVLYVQRGGAHPRTRVSLDACLELAAMGAERALVTEAVAEARGVSVQTARKNHAREMRTVRSEAPEMGGEERTQRWDRGPEDRPTLLRRRRVTHPHANPTDGREVGYRRGGPGSERRCRH
ncbi:MAG: hypothetical protein ABIJ48_01690 [Actinomycetota bacterium]